MAISVVINPYQKFYDSDGVTPLSNGTITFYENKTTTLASIYSDQELTVAQNNPYTLDAGGRIQGDVRFAGSLTMKIEDSDGATVRTLDNVTCYDTGVAFNDWNQFTNYGSGGNNIVTGSDGNYYVSNTSNNSGNDPANGASEWDQFELINVNDAQATELESLGTSLQGNSGLIKTTITNGITADSNQDQSNATALTTVYSRVSTVGSAGDAVKLPSASNQQVVFIINDGSNNLQVFPASGDAIDGGSADAADSNQIPPGMSRSYISIDGTNWYTASINPNVPIFSNIRLTGLTTGHVVTANSSGSLNAIDMTTAGDILAGDGSGAPTVVNLGTKGHLLVGDGAGAPSTLAPGSNGQRLEADSSASEGVKWVDADGAQSLASSGYQTFADGLIVQWGEETGISRDTNESFNLPITFPTAGLQAVATWSGDGLSIVRVVSLTTTQITLRGSNQDGVSGGTTDIAWVAIGH